MQIQSDPSRVKGLLSLLTSLLGVLLLWILVAFWAFRSSWWKASAATNAAASWALPLFKRYLAVVALALLAMVLVGGVTNFRERWLLPLLCAVPLMAFAVRPDLQQHPRAGLYTRAVTVIALLLLVAAGARLWFGYIRGNADELNHPILELASTLREAGYDGQSPIIAADHMLAGTLRTRFPQAHAQSCTGSDGQDIAVCVTEAVKNAQLAGQGYLLISRADRLDPEWWSRAQSRLPPQAVLGVKLPFHQLAALPPAHYQFAWQPARTTP